MTAGGAPHGSRSRDKSADGASGHSSADIILIPKWLRLDWIDRMAGDPALSNTAFRVACVIGSHFNGRSGGAYLRQDTIAKKTGIDERTVRRAIRDLEKATGYLVVERRELGRRTSDRRRACGGKGVANTYRPAVDGRQLFATDRHLKEVIHDHLSDDQRRANPALKEGARALPTLTSPSEKNRPRAQAHTRARKAATLWSEAGERLKRRLGAAVFESWFGETTIERKATGEIMVAVRSAFHRNYVLNHFLDQLQDALSPPDGGRPRVEIVVQAQGGSAEATVVDLEAATLERGGFA